MFDRNAWRRERYQNDPEYRQQQIDKARAYADAHREEKRSYDRAKYAADPEPFRARAREAKSLSRYGLTTAQAEELWAAQGSKCALCGRVPRVYYVDHDHATGAVRQLLCPSCNIGLGQFRDDPELMRKAAAYVEAFRGE